MKKLLRTSRALVAVSISLILTALSAGLAPYQAVAANFEGPAAPKGAPLSAVPELKLPAPASGLTPGAQVSGTPSVSADAQQPVAPAGAEASAQPAAVPAVQALQTGASGVQQAKSSGQEGSALGRMFEASAVKPADSPVPTANVSPNGGRDGSLPLAVALEKRPLSDLETVARDGTKSPADRQAAVKAIASHGAEAMPVLERIGTSDPEANAAGYEIKRQALRALADLGKVVSLPAISRAHADEILKTLRQQKPEIAAFDYDGTLEDFKKPISRETAQALKAAAGTGTEVMVLTDRPTVKQGPTDETIFSSLQGMTPEERSAISVGGRRGAQVALFDTKGDMRTVREEPGWSPLESKALKDATAAVAAKFGTGVFDGRVGELLPYSWAHFLPVGLTDEQVQAAARMMEAELAKAGVNLKIVGKLAMDPKNPPTLSTAKYDKSIGITALRNRREFFIRARGIVRYLPSWLQPAALKIAAKVKETAVDVKSTLVVGDYFGPGFRNVDTDMVKGAPGALAIAVGGSADPRVENVFVWPTKAKAASLELLGAIAKPAAQDKDGMNVKAIKGMFAQRTLSICAFIGTALAYPFIANHYTHGAYGTLISLGQLVGIALGPLTGIVADRLSARKAMGINTALRAIFALELPLTIGLHIINFWTMLVGAVANGWLLSSIMTTEGTFMRRLAGDKNLLWVNSLALINYYFLQVLLNGLIGVGKFVTPHNWLVPFLLSTVIHAVVVMGIIWKTIPNLAPIPKDLRNMQKQADLNGSELGSKLTLLTVVQRAKAPGWEKKADALEHEIELLQENGKALNAAIAARQKAIPDELAKLQKEREELAKSDKSAGQKAYREKLIARKETLLKEEQAGKVPSGSVRLRRALQSIGLFASRYWFPIAAFGAAFAAFLHTHSALPVTASLVFWISRTDSFKALWANKNLRWAALFIALSAFLIYPFQSFALQLIAGSIATPAAKFMLYGKFLTALFLGQMLGSSLQSKLPKIKLAPIIGRVPGQRLVQAGALALLGLSIGLRLMPGHWLIAAGVMAGMAGLLSVLSRLTERGIIRFVGVGMASIFLPLLAPGSLPLIYATALLIGFSNGPAFNALNTYFQTNGRKSNLGAAIGVQGSFLNAAISFGYGALALAASLYTHPFPSILRWMGPAYVVGGILFFLAPRLLTGLPEKSWRGKTPAATPR